MINFGLNTYIRYQKTIVWPAEKNKNLWNPIAKFAVVNQVVYIL